MQDYIGRAERMTRLREIVRNPARGHEAAAEARAHWQAIYGGESINLATAEGQADYTAAADLLSRVQRGAGYIDLCAIERARLQEEETETGRGPLRALGWTPYIYDHYTIGYDPAYTRLRTVGNTARAETVPAWIFPAPYDIPDDPAAIVADPGLLDDRCIAVSAARGGQILDAGPMGYYDPEDRVTTGRGTCIAVNNVSEYIAICECGCGRPARVVCLTAPRGAQALAGKLVQAGGARIATGGLPCALDVSLREAVKAAGLPDIIEGRLTPPGAASIPDAFRGRRAALSQHIADIQDDPEIVTPAGRLKALSAARLCAIYDDPANTSWGAPGGISTGLRALDAALSGGLRAQRLYIIGAPPGAGKTSLACYMAETQAEAGRPVLYVSLEMTERQLFARAISRYEYAADPKRARDTQAVLDRAQLDGTAEGRQLLTRALMRYSDMASGRLWIREGAATARDIRETVESYTQALGAAPVVYVDYIHRIRDDSSGRKEIRQIITDVTRELKQIAIDYTTPVLAIAACNRESYRGTEVNLYPAISDLRDSSELEYSADVILQLKEYYCLRRPDSGTGPAEPIPCREVIRTYGRDVERRTVGLHVTKNRFGRETRPGIIELYYYPAYNYFAEAAGPGGGYGKHL